MWLLNIRLSLRKLYRAIEIIWLVVSHLISDWWVGTRMSRWFRRKARTAQEVQSRTQEVRIRELIEDLGPTFVKFGQILADRPDLISEKLRNELKKLQTTARPIPDSEAIALIEEELGGPIEIFFESMDMVRIASASIGQVYTGVLKNGEKVVIKIQRPGIVSKIKIDLMLLKLVATYLVKRYPEAASLNIVSVVAEFSDSLMKELNYHMEAGNILRFAELMKNDPTFYAPKVYTSFTTSRLLVMEYIDGITPDETERLVREGYDLHQIAVNGANILLKMILQHGVFHADPHGGNIFILPGNRICFIDYGMVAVLRPTHIQFLADFTMGFALSDSKKIANSLIKLSGHRFFDFEEDLRFDVQETINRYSYLPIEKANISAVMMDCVSLIVKYKLQIPSSIYMLLKAIATIGKFGEKLSPEFEFTTILIPYAQQVILREFSPQRFFHGLTDMIGDYIEMIRELPRDINEILYKAKQGKLVHEISLKEDKRLRKSLRIVGMNLGLGLVTVILIICSTILSSRDQAPTVATLEFIGAFITGGWLLLRSMRRSMPG
jgi:ubiquinone biosynthesis protein